MNKCAEKEGFFWTPPYRESRGRYNTRIKVNQTKIEISFELCEVSSGDRFSVCNWDEWNERSNLIEIN